jgi:hypothetical protein
LPGLARRRWQLFIADFEFHGAVRNVDHDGVAGLDQGDVAAFGGLGRDVADRQTRGAAGEAAVGDQRADFARPLDFR